MNTPLRETVANATLVLRRGQESLWLSNDLTTTGKRYFIACSRNGHTDYPIVALDRVLWDFPERFSKPFRVMVSAHMRGLESQTEGR